VTENLDELTNIEELKAWFAMYDSLPSGLVATKNKSVIAAARSYLALMEGVIQCPNCACGFETNPRLLWETDTQPVSKEGSG
jgi:hypothetical protein